ncbi:hypothetical protein AXF42_Ash009861 [Apostasia shenzhenica]|uniref:Transposase, Ptta/En/Spm, plant n=1 Tax=Apostasia shenzhenica TaxID=1088818 RepID=A0A2I0AC53_9ASPA|nr:hypothetical protein AXF42_Ash009861 [Apostasia shenzhenica]
MHRREQIVQCFLFIMPRDGSSRRSSSRRQVEVERIIDRDEEEQNETGDNNVEAMDVDEPRSSNSSRPRGPNLGTQAPSQSSGRTWLYPGDRHGWTDQRATRDVTVELRANITGPWLSWLQMPETTKQLLWDKFQNKYQWHPEDERRIKEAWDQVSFTRYRDILYRARQAMLKELKSKNTKDLYNHPPKFIASNIWNDLVKEWCENKWANKSTKFKENRSTQMVRHTGGSLPFEEWRKKLADEMRREPTHIELFNRTHRRESGKGDFVDERSRLAHERYEAEMLRRHINPTTASTFDADAWCAAVGQPKKNTMYGWSPYIHVNDILDSRRAYRNARASYHGSQPMGPVLEEMIQRAVELARQSFEPMLHQALQQMQ